MRLSTPIFISFLTRRHNNKSLPFIRNIPSYYRNGKLAAPVIFAGASISTLSNVNPAIDDLTKKLDDLAPRFELQNGQVVVLTTPEEFYSILKHKILNAKKRVFLSSLYIGKEEKELVNTIVIALDKNPSLHVSILIDALRGTREAPKECAASLLVPLVERFPDRVDVRLYHTPNFRGLKKRIIPQRFNEGWGLQHIKLYGTDDELILSGANLSRDYFTNRQDRYHLFKSKELTNYYAKFHEVLRSISYRLVPAPDRVDRFLLEWPEGNGCPEPYISPKEYRTHATKLISPLLRPTKTVHASSAATLVYPISQLVPLSEPESDTLATETSGVSYVLDMLSQQAFKGGNWVFTAGYFNPSSTVKAGLIASGNSTNGIIINASAEANGFYGSPNPSGYLPDAYMILAKRFLQDVRTAGVQNAIKMEQWRHVPRTKTLDGWTYHAKGIWITPPNCTDPVLTLIGSSNFTRRSHRLDLESTCVVITRDTALQSALSAEIQHLRKFTDPTDIEDLSGILAEGGLRRSLAVKIWVALVGEKL